MERAGRLLSILCCLGGLSLKAAEPTAQELAAQLQTAVTKATGQPEARVNDPAEAAGDAPQIYMAQLALAVPQAFIKADTGLVRDLESRIERQVPNAEVAKLGQAILAQVTTEITAQQRAYADTLDAMAEKAVPSCFVARAPKDLDATIMDLSGALQRPNAESTLGPSPETRKRAKTALTFACRWQDFLSKVSAGNNDDAQSFVMGLAQDETFWELVPRSKVLEQIKLHYVDLAEKGQPQLKLPSLAGKKLADLDDLVLATEQMYVKNRHVVPLRQFWGRMAYLQQAAKEAQLGLVTPALAHSLRRGKDEASKEFAPLWEELLSTILPSYLGTTATYPVKKGESAQDYLLRVAHEAGITGDWKTSWKALETYRQVVFGGNFAPDWLTMDLEGISQFLQAQGLERGGQYAGAVRLYRWVQAGTYAPTRETELRLKALKAEHPKDYEAGTQDLIPEASPQSP